MIAVMMMAAVLAIGSTVENIKARVESNRIERLVQEQNHRSLFIPSQ